MKQFFTSKITRLVAAGTIATGAILGLAARALAVTNLDLGLNQVQNTIALGNRDIRETIADIINVLMGLLGIIAVVMILIGGFKWMTAGGNEDKVGEAKKFIIQGIVGLVIILSSWAIARFVLTQLQTATT